ncbi:hypothetical protein ACFZAV_27730 [Streptomyces sp. NPDC008343]|uniref:hypothetical protein n=1 Tax=Streptomyces sp. NPDC008343 TaxID=3364828 RepID=UPI0036E8E89E
MGPESRRKDLGVQADLRSALVAGDPLLLEQMIRNLVDKAVKYNLHAPGADAVPAARRWAAASVSMTFATIPATSPASSLPCPRRTSA